MIRFELLDCIGVGRVSVVFDPEQGEQAGQGIGLGVFFFAFAALLHAA